jgi:hypothetical protein
MVINPSVLFSKKKNSLFLNEKNTHTLIFVEGLFDKDCSINGCVIGADVDETEDVRR